MCLDTIWIWTKELCWNEICYLRKQDNACAYSAQIHHGTGSSNTGIVLWFLSLILKPSGSWFCFLSPPPQMIPYCMQNVKWTDQKNLVIILKTSFPLILTKKKKKKKKKKRPLVDPRWPLCDLWPKQYVTLWSGVLHTKFGGHRAFLSNLTSVTSAWPQIPLHDLRPQQCVTLYLSQGLFWPYLVAMG